jgi:TolB-like protein/class 3 adenylate cyclase/Tfp pilus assembly protein PilF
MPAASVERRLAAILAADVVGYARLIEQDEAGTLARLKELRRSVIEPILARHGGRIVKLMGDGALVEFPSASEAVQAAVEVQQAVLRHERDHSPGDRVQFRIGISLGDVVHEDNDIFGEGVNLASRLEQLAEPGGICVSGPVHEQARHRLPIGFALLGRHRVKNLAEPVEVWRVQTEGVAAKARRRYLGVNLWRMAAATGGLVLVLAGAAWWLWPTTSEVVNKPAIAVLPFANLGGDAATGRLADGITEDVITDPARFRDLTVIARNSTLKYKDQPADLREVGRELGVRYVLEGSIQHAGERVRVTAQLIEAGSGGHVWSERWDRPADDVFAVQSELAEQVANKLGGYGVVAQADRTEAKRKRPENLTAYDLYLLGVELKHRQLSREDLEQARDLLDRAIALDPKLARAYVARGWVDILLTNYGAPWEEHIRAMEIHARSALALDPQDAEAHVVLAEALFGQGRYGESVAEYDKALAINPNSADILQFSAGNLAQMGQVERAVELADRAMQLNPNYPGYYSFALCPVYFFGQRFADVVAVVDKLPEVQRYLIQLTFLAASLAELDRNEEATAAAAALRAQQPGASAELAVNTGSLLDSQRDVLVDGLRTAGLPLCATEDDLAGIAQPVRLPECKTERIKRAATRS